MFAYASFVIALTADFNCYWEQVAWSAQYTTREFCDENKDGSNEGSQLQLLSNVQLKKET
jgi:hypothetical protein